MSKGCRRMSGGREMLLSWAGASERRDGDVWEATVRTLAQVAYDNQGFVPSEADCKPALVSAHVYKHNSHCRNHRGLRHYWGLTVRGQHTKTTGRRGKTVGVAKKR